MTNRTLISFLLGLTSAVVFVSAATGPALMRIVLFLITPLPIFLAGLGWGPVAAILAGGTATAIVGLFGFKAALFFAASQAAPAVILSYLALLSRDDAGPDAKGIPQREWYPAGRLVVWAAGLAAIPSVLWLAVMGEEAAALKETLGPALSDLIKSQFPVKADGTPIGPEDLARITDTIIELLPSMSAIAWMTALLFNLWLAGRIMVASGHLLRPWPDMAAIEYPHGTALALAVTTLAAFAGGTVGKAFLGFSATLLVAFVILGLAVIHYVTRGMSWRPFLLWGLYGSLLFLNGPLALPLALLGLADTIFHFRYRASQRAGPPGPPPPQT